MIRQLFSFFLVLGYTSRADKAEITQLITGFTKTHKRNHPGACERWHDDIHFVNGYKIGQQEHIHGLQFKQGGKITR